MSRLVIGSSWGYRTDGNRGQLLLLTCSNEAEACGCITLAACRLYHQRGSIGIKITTRSRIDCGNNLSVTPAKLPVAFPRLSAGKPILRNPQWQAISRHKNASSG